MMIFPIFVNVYPFSFTLDVSFVHRPFLSKPLMLRFEAENPEPLLNSNHDDSSIFLYHCPSSWKVEADQLLGVGNNMFY